MNLRRLLRPAFPAAALVWFCACGTPAADASVDVDLPEGSTDALQGGYTTTGYNAVGLVVMESGAFCTGTLIRRNVVLTAAHCAAEDVHAFYIGRGEALDEQDLSRRGLAEALEKMDEYRVSRQVAHHGYDEQWCGLTPDIALLKLYRGVRGVWPLRLASSATAQPGRTCTAVGFGAHDDGDGTTWARKRKGTEEIIQVHEDGVLVRAGSAVADHGDSGGPLLCGGKVAGVTSCGNTGGGMETRLIFYARPDMQRQWIDARLNDWGLE